jgi:hypothetical protein
MARRLGLCGLFFVAFLVLPTCARAATITLDSQPQGVDFLSVNILISDITDLYLFDFFVSFDPTALALQEITEGSFLATVGDTFSFFVPVVDIDGRITPVPDFSPVQIVSTLTTPIAGASGSGLLATMLFQGVSSASLFITPASFRDSSLNEIADVRYAAPQPVPEPSTLGLLGIGLAAMARRMRRRTPATQSIERSAH